MTTRVSLASFALIPVNIHMLGKHEHLAKFSLASFLI
jgi:hypothetical protein